MIINLIRESDSALYSEAVGVPVHRVGVQAAAQFDDAEREVRRRVLRSLADRESPPTAVVFVRTWEQPAHGTELEVPIRVEAEAPPRRGRRRGG